jgi:RNA polymerase sigma-70 factor (ECF subfamily)
MIANVLIPYNRSAVCSHDFQPRDDGMSSRITRFLLPGSATDETQTVETEAGDRTGNPSLLDRLKLQFNSDEELAAKLQAGHSEALSVLFERHHALLFHSARRILRNDAEAEDAVQQIFLDLFRSAGKFDPARGPFKGWLVMFGYCRIISRWRQLQSNRFYDSENFEDALPEIMQAARRTFPFQAAEARRLVEQALEQIKPRQRRTIELIYYEGLTPEEVSVRTGESVRIVRHNLYRGLEKVRDVLGHAAIYKNSRRGNRSGTKESGSKDE